MTKLLHIVCWSTVLFLGALANQSSNADTQSALAAMEDPRNPLMQVQTSRGDFFIELFPAAAPRNVANFIALAHGQIEMFDSETDTVVTPNFYQNTYFHRVIPNFLTQAGMARRESDPAPENLIADEINARQFGLHQMPVLDELGKPHPWLNLANKQDFEDVILQPLYKKLGILTPEALESRQFEIIEALQDMTLQQAYENLGYRYHNLLPSRPTLRGHIGMASTEPNSNSTQFFVLNSDAPWLRGRVTIIGRIVEGMEVVDRINQLSRVGDYEFEPNLNNATMLFDIHQVNAAP